MKNVLRVLLKGKDDQDTPNFLVCCSYWRVAFLVCYAEYGLDWMESDEMDYRWHGLEWDGMERKDASDCCWLY